MQIQNSNMRYTGSYSILNTNRGSSFPYAMKVDGVGTLGNRKSLFSFGKVTITEHMVTAKYGTKITNGSRVHMRTSGSKKPVKNRKIYMIRMVQAHWLNLEKNK